jgi:RNA polymerase-binding transcription factor DksA
VSGERDRNADPIDQAAQLSADMLDADIKNARAGAAPESHPDFDGKHCVEEECGVKIPAARLKLGRIRCVDCQGRRETATRRDDPIKRGAR